MLYKVWQFIKLKNKITTESYYDFLEFNFSWRFFWLWLCLDFWALVLFWHFLFLLNFLFFLCFLSLLLLYFLLHPFQLIETILNLEHNLISFLFFMLQLFGQRLVLFVGFPHPLFILICNGYDFIDRDCICGIWGWFLVDRDNVCDFLFEGDWLKFVLIHDLSSIEADFVEMIKGLLGYFFFLCLRLRLLSFWDLRLFLLDILGFTLLHFFQYLNFYSRMNLSNNPSLI